MPIEWGSTYKPDDGEEKMKGGDMGPKEFSIPKDALDNTIEKFANKDEKLKNLKNELFVMTNDAVSPESCLQQLDTIEKEIKEVTDETLARLENNDLDKFEKILMDMVTTYGKDFVLAEIKLQKDILKQEIAIEKNYHTVKEN